jgi:PBP1b-binding outer membrane lipoprotein LpoB
MNRILMLVLLVALVSGCQRREHREATQSSEKTKTRDTTAAVNTNESSTPDTVRIVSGTGLVRHIDLEGGFYGIVDDMGERYDPSNLPEDFKVDSLRVRYEATVTDKMTTHMWGRPVDIITIERFD